MTVCVATICGDGKCLVLVSDRMIGVGYVEAEPEIKKNIPLHERWRALFAGDDISPAFDILDAARLELEGREANVNEVVEAVTNAYCQKRRKDGEAIHLTTRNWTSETFRAEAGKLIPESIYREIDYKLEQFEFTDLQILVAGFDRSGRAHIFTVTSADRGVAKRCDIPGFHAIGSGGTGAVFMMYHRSLSPKTSVREACYYALEAKYFGEQATGVGTSTDMYIVRPDGSSTVLDDEKIIEKKLIPICQRLEPRKLDKKAREVLNSLSELQGFENVAEPEKKSTKKHLRLTETELTEAEPVTPMSPSSSEKPRKFFGVEGRMPGE